MDQYFVSYSRVDLEVALRAAASIDDRNPDAVWLDVDRIAAGDQWWDKTDQALVASRAVLLIVSRYSERSAEVIDECRRAKNHKIPIIAIVIDNSASSLLTLAESTVDLRHDPLSGSSSVDWTPQADQVPIDERPCWPDAVTARAHWLAIGVPLAWIAAAVVSVVYFSLEHLARTGSEDDARSAALVWMVGLLTTVPVAMWHRRQLLQRRHTRWWLGGLLAAGPYVFTTYMAVAILLVPTAWWDARGLPMGSVVHNGDLLELAVNLICAFLVFRLLADLVAVARVGRFRVISSTWRAATSAASTLLQPMGDGEYVRAWLPAHGRRQTRATAIRTTRAPPLVEVEADGVRVRAQAVDLPLARWLAHEIARQDGPRLRNSFEIVTTRLQVLAAQRRADEPVLVVLRKFDRLARASSAQLVDGSHLRLDALVRQLTAAAQGRIERVPTNDLHLGGVLVSRSAATRALWCGAASGILGVVLLVPPGRGSTLPLRSLPTIAIVPFTVYLVGVRAVPISVVTLASWTALGAALMSNLQYLGDGSWSRSGVVLAVLVSVSWAALVRNGGVRAWFGGELNALAVVRPIPLSWCLASCATLSIPIHDVMMSRG